MLKGEEEVRNIKYREKILRESGSEKRDDRYRKFEEKWENQGKMSVMRYADIIISKKRRQDDI